MHPEYSEDELSKLYQLFCRYAEPSTKKGTISLDSFKKLLEALELTQTHLVAKETYDKAAKDGKISLEEFMKLVKELTAKTGKINLDLVVKLAAQEEVNVDDVGVGGAKRFFEAKARILEVGDAAYRAFEDKKKEEEDKKKRQEEFKKKREQFQPAA
ncbi:EF-hand domain-containing protein D2 homolog isoform X2 [Procambarus clarkii]|uniref:EF-hand domain-containing protein D2 homolog isoform X2 n=1 Tax=Procambarus clarkii TaxID=6728 RepID=UPI001E678AA0|nr:EF-hand domain-containing protein D2 homolog isoform X2 [Procambarus clarkii]